MAGGKDRGRSPEGRGSASEASDLSDSGAPVHVRFDAFELDEINARLLRQGQPLPVAPTPFALLCALVRQSGSLITKGALLDAVWGHRYVSDSVLKSAISELRTTLGDDARRPRYIETVARRGYRFIGHPSATPLPQRAGDAGHHDRPCVSLAAALCCRVCRARGSVRRRQTDHRLGRGRARDRQDHAHRALCARVSAMSHRVAVNACSSTASASLPSRPPSAWRAVPQELGCAVSGYCAPSLRPGCCSCLGLALRGARNTAPGARRALPDRMLRELGEFLDRYTENRPLLLITEDLHWSDQPTIQLIDFLARRRSEARLHVARRASGSPRSLPRSSAQRAAQRASSARSLRGDRARFILGGGGRRLHRAA